MIGSRILFVTIGFVVINLKMGQAELNDEGKQKIVAFLLPHVGECNKEYTIGEGALQEVLKTGKADAINPCFIACVFKRIEIIDDKGMFNGSKTLEIAKELLPAEKQEKFPGFLKSCSSVNEKEVSDGNQGCERVKLVLECASPLISSFYTLSK